MSLKTIIGDAAQYSERTSGCPRRVIDDLGGPLNFPAAELEFQEYPKTPRLFRDIVITEKLDGTNAQIVIDLASEAQKAGHFPGETFCVSGDFAIRAGSRKRWITPLDDNFGFAQWVLDHKHELVKLGPGRHFGEWYGAGIQRTYGLKEKRFALFNVNRWYDSQAAFDATRCRTETMLPVPPCCTVVPTLYSGPFSTDAIFRCNQQLAAVGSAAVPGFMRPEGVVIYHTAAKQVFKALLENDDKSKGE